MHKERSLMSARERLNRAVRAVDRSEWQTRQEIRFGADNVLHDPNVSPVELVSEVVFIAGQRVLKWPVALIVGVEEFFRRR